MQSVMRCIMQDAKIQKALAQIEQQSAQTIAEQMELCAIRAFSNHETQRAKRFFEMFQTLGFDEVSMDEVDNVFGVVHGTGQGPVILISAHMDTVFGMDVDCTPRVDENGVIHAPGIADDTRGMAEILATARAMLQNGIRARGTIIFAGDVGEESHGNLRGMRNIFDKPNHGIDAFISIDGARPEVLTFNGLGSYKYRITYRGSGGHTYHRFGIPSASFAMGRAIAKIADLQVPQTPRTVYNVGVANSGITVSGIPAEATMHIDMRSVDKAALDELRDRILAACHAACAEENARWGNPAEAMQVEIDCFGERPCGSQPQETVIVQAAMAAYRAFGIEPALSAASSTDANYPISLGIPSVTISRCGRGAANHTLAEHYDPAGGHIGPQRALVLLLALAGYDPVCTPLLRAENG